MHNQSNENEANPSDTQMWNGHGVFSSRQIERLIRKGFVASTPAVEARQVQPASLDLRLGNIAYRVRASFLSGPDVCVRDKLRELCLYEISLSNAAVLDVGSTYIIPLVEAFRLPAGVSATANPKSSSGRLNVFTRMIIDRGQAFDTMPSGYHGSAYLEVSPRSFPVLVRQGSCLNQIRFHQGDHLFSDMELISLHRDDPLVDTDTAEFSGGLRISIDLKASWSDRKDDNIIGYRARRYTNLIDIDAVNSLDIIDFWEPISLNGQETSLLLDPAEFYILVSREGLRIPPLCAAEMLPFDHCMGEFRVHYAGFFDPGFGYTKSGDNPVGARAVLEVSSRDVPFILNHRQTVARLVFSKMQRQPQRLYGESLGSHYQWQGLKLSKHFRM